MRKILSSFYICIKTIFYKFRLLLYKKHENIFGDHVIVGRNSRLYKTVFGKHSACNSGCTIVNCTIGNYTNISWNVTIGPRGHIYTNFTVNDFVYLDNEFIEIANRGSFDGFFNKIGSDVWIGCNAILLPGVEIGNGAIVAAGSVVNKSVPPYAIVGGNPAKFIKWRFDKKTIQKLEAIKWYEFDLDEVLDKRMILQGIVGFDLDAFKLKYQSKKVNFDPSENS